MNPLYLHFSIHCFKMKHYEQLKSLTGIGFLSLLIYFLTKNEIFIWLTLFFLLLSIFPNKLAEGVSSIWNGSIHFLGIINSKIILTLLFFIILTPVAIFFRIFNRKKVEYFKKNSKDSYFKPTRKKIGNESFEDLW